MFRHRFVISAAFFALLVVTFVPKLALGTAAARMTDDDRLAAAITSRLRGVGFTTKLVSSNGVVVLAARGSCRMQVRNGDDARVYGTIFAQTAEGYGPIRYGYRGLWTTTPAASRAVLERAVQNQLAIVRVSIARPAVIALAEAGDCHRGEMSLEGLPVFAKRAN